MSELREYEIVLVPEATGFSVFVPELPSVATQGETVEEAVAMAKEAIELYVETMEEEGLPIPRCSARASRLAGERSAAGDFRQAADQGA
jgi:predicted RNase H-like HicB family nuclease